MIDGASLEEFADEKQWENFYNISPQRTPFSSFEFLNLKGNFHKKYALKQKDEILAALIVPLNAQGIPKPGSFGSMHQGILFNPRVDSSPSMKTEIFLTLLRLAVTNEIKFDIALHPNISDIRPVNWLNSELTDGKKIEIQVRFTGIITLNEFSDFEQYLNSLPKMRRDEIQKNSLRIEHCYDASLFAELYKESFSIRGIEFTNDEWVELTEIFQFATNHPHGKLTLAFEGSISKPIAGIITIEDVDTVYYWFAATKPGFRQKAGNSKLLSVAICHAIESKKFRVDTCGMNSKEIGFFKGSFGAIPTPTYQLRYS